ncbi:hypothetical protein [Sinorhizobium fredii]|uniref:hypothetical protein n=1 Tax=Rhizobium fredii TaxID=380 RepID=UPI0029587539|nr:hypothetical protein [Sinorhizobium fredii]
MVPVGGLPAKPAHGTNHPSCRSANADATGKVEENAVRSTRTEEVPMPQKENKLQKLTLMLGQTVAAMRVNEMLTCRLLRWIAAQTDDPQRFIAEAVDDIRNELRSAAEEDGSTVTAEAAKQALQYLDNLGAEMLAPRRHKRASAEIKDLSPLDEYRFPPFTSALDGPMNGTARHRDH